MRGYSSYNLTKECRKELLEKFPPKYHKVVAHHVTYEFGNVDKDNPPPVPNSIKIKGYYDTGDGLEVFVVEVDSTINRHDGSYWHITWSLTPNKYKPVDSNTVLRDNIKNVVWFQKSIDLEVEPTVNIF